MRALQGQEDNLTTRSLALLATTMFAVSALAIAPTASSEDGGCKGRECKVRCEWEFTGAGPTPIGAAFGAAADSRTATQIVTLICPRHQIVSDWDFTATPSGGTDGLPTDGPPDIQYLGGTPMEVACAQGESRNYWYVMVPNVQSWRVSLDVWTWKDENCDGQPDDWAHDPAAQWGGGECLEGEQPAGDGARPYEGVPGPDGKVNGCDCQMYNLRWGQWH